MRLLKRPAQTEHTKFSTFFPGRRLETNMNSINELGIVVAID
jgi:hypothetical protein